MRKRHNIGLWPLIVLGGQFLSSWRAEHTHRLLPQVFPVDRRDVPSGGVWPVVSVIVPARNEEANLPRLLDSLVTQDYPLYEVLVIDDASTDSTADIVRRYEQQGVRLIQSAGPPHGWTGKNAACWLGAEASLYPWLLFVDADTELAPLALRSSLSFALEHKRNALSLFPRQRCDSFWERLLLPFAYQHYFVGMNARRLHSAHGPALANGQYFLIHRTAYQKAGGHAVQPESIIDDVALATRLKASGTISLACRGEELVSVRMYTRLSDIAQGFGKNSYLFLRQSPFAGIQTAASTSLAASVPILCIDACRKKSRVLFGLAGLAYCMQVVGNTHWSRRFGVNVRYSLLTPLSAFVFLAIALNSMLRVLTGRSLSWKGRSYLVSPSGSKHARYRFPRRWIMDMGRALLSKTPRSIIEDSALAVSVLPQPPHVTGTEHIPRHGSFVLVANHYQRRDLWIGWSGAVLIDAIAKQRDIHMRFVTTDRARIGRVTIPGTRWLIERVAAVWDLVLVTPPAITRNKADASSRYTLLRILRSLKRTDGHAICIGFMPEGDEGNTHGLIEALPGSGRALSALSAQNLPLVPAAVWEEDSRLCAAFGEPFTLATPPANTSSQTLDCWVRNRTMHHIAALLPPALRGKFK